MSVDVDEYGCIRMYKKVYMHALVNIYYICILASVV